MTHYVYIDVHVLWRLPVFLQTAPEKSALASVQKQWLGKVISTFLSNDESIREAGVLLYSMTIEPSLYWCRILIIKSAILM